MRKKYVYYSIPGARSLSWTGCLNCCVCQLSLAEFPTVSSSLRRSSVVNAQSLYPELSPQSMSALGNLNMQINIDHFADKILNNVCQQKSQSGKFGLLVIWNAIALSLRLSLSLANTNDCIDRYLYSRIDQLSIRPIRVAQSLFCRAEPLCRFSIALPLVAHVVQFERFL